MESPEQTGTARANKDIRERCVCNDAGAGTAAGLKRHWGRSVIYPMHAAASREAGTSLTMIDATREGVLDRA